MTAGQARLYVQYVPVIVADLMAVINTRPEPRVKTDLVESIKVLQALMLEANAALEHAGKGEA